jgi:hypothetical protein
MPVRLTAYLPNAAAWRLLRTQAPIRIGRAADCEFQVDHPSVSRSHAELSWQAPAWRLRDLGSKNGSFVEGRPIDCASLGDSAWFRVGDVVCEFASVDDEEAANLEHRQEMRRANSVLMLEGIGKQTALPDLLLETLRSIVELSDCERGFLLLAAGGSLEVAASVGMDTNTLGARNFRGSIGVVQRALLEKLPVVVNEGRFDAELAGRRSVIAGGLQTLVCIPLIADGRAIGLAYADSSQPGALITTMDLDLLRAFAERAAVWIAARRGLDALAAMASGNPGWSDILAAQQLASA